MKFIVRKKVRFHHCDPAGIVFYPQFFVLLHEVQEDFLAHIGFAEHLLIGGGHGLPIVDLSTQFIAMCRHGETLAISLELSRIGNTSIAMHYEIHGAGMPGDVSESVGTLRLKADGVVVFSEVPGGKPVRIPPTMREALHPYLNHPPTP